MQESGFPPVKSKIPFIYNVKLNYEQFKWIYLNMNDI